MNNLEKINYNLEKDLIITIRSELPDDTTGSLFDWYAQQQFIQRVEQDADNWYKFNVILANGKTITAEKKEHWRSWWVFNIDEKTYNTKYSTDLRRMFNKMLLTLKEQYEYNVKHFDWTYEMSDDFRYWNAGERHLKEIKEIEKELIEDGEKVFVEQIWNKYNPENYGELIIQ